MRFGYDNVHAAATASVAQIAPVFLMPILGLCLDKYGKRTWMSKSIYYVSCHVWIRESNKNSSQWLEAACLSCLQWLLCSTPIFLLLLVWFCSAWVCHSAQWAWYPLSPSYCRYLSSALAWVSSNRERTLAPRFLIFSLVFCKTQMHTRVTMAWWSFSSAFLPSLSWLAWRCASWTTLFTTTCLISRQEMQSSTEIAAKAAAQHWRSWSPIISMGEFSLPPVSLAGPFSSITFCSLRESLLFLLPAQQHATYPSRTFARLYIFIYNSYTTLHIMN